MKILIAACQRYFWPAFLFLGFIFLPAFIHCFSAHTDGFYIITQKGNWLGNKEADALIMQGRPFFAWLNSFLGWHLSDIHQFTLLRIFIFATKVLDSCLLYLFCRSINISYVWAFLTAAFFVLLPSNMLNVLWTSNGMPESLALLAGIFSYMMLTTTLLKKPNYILAGILFLLALLTYQPMAMIVFAFIFLRVLFADQSSWGATRLEIIKQFALYGPLLGVYWMIVKCVILPYGKNVLGLSPLNSNIYDMELIHNISNKYALVMDLLKYSMVGTWDAVFHNNSHLEWMMIRVFAIIAIVSVVINKGLRSGNSIGITLQKIILAVALFLLANVPSLMPTNYTQIIGYRTFLPSSLMGLALVIYYFRYACQTYTNKIFKILAYCLVGIYFIALACVGSWLIHQTIRNYLKENSYIQSIASKIDYHKTDKILLILNRPGDTVIEYDLPFEFSLTTTTADHIRFMFEKYSFKIGKGVDFKEIFLDWPVCIDDRTQVVDLPSLRGMNRNTYARPGSRMQVYTSAEADEHVSVMNLNNDPANPTLLFKSNNPTMHQEYYWLVMPGQTTESVYVHYIDRPKIPMGYKLEAGCIDNAGKPCSFLWQIQTSVDNIKWESLTAGVWTNAVANTLRDGITFPENKSVPYVKITFTKKNIKDILVIKDLQLFGF